MEGKNYSEIDKQFLHYFNSIHNDAQYALSNYRIGEIIIGLSEDKIKVFNISPNTWNIIFEALKTDFIITLSCIYDVKKDFTPRSDINIFTFIKFIKNNFDELFNREKIKIRNQILSDDSWMLKNIPILTLKDIDNDLNKINSKKDDIITLMYFRDKSYAHKDKEFLKGADVERLNVTYHQLKSLLELSIEIIEKYRLCLEGVKYAFPQANLIDIQKTIDILFEHLQVEKEKLLNRIKGC